MKKLFIKSISIIFLGLIFQACTNDFDEINTNPNAPEEVNAGLLLPNVILTPANEMTLVAWGNGNIVMQLVATSNFTDFDRYLWGSNSGTWNTMYRTIRDAITLQQIGSETNNTSYQGVALVMKAWMVSILTDMYGDVPYSEAIQGKSSENYTPRYDPQESIYNAILADLETANNLLSVDGPGISGDILFEGDLLKWKKLANSLRIRYLMRLEKKRPDVGTQIQAIIDTQPIMESLDDNGALSYLSSAPNQWPLHTSRVGSFDEKRMSKTIETVLREINDPRLEILFRPIDNPDSVGIYRGIPNGLSEGNAVDYNGGRLNQSRLGTMFRESPDAVDMTIMHYPELQFILAEAAQKGMISGKSAEDYYLEGIRATMEYYGATVEAGYYTQPGVVFATGSELELIARQKWLSLMMVGMEAWFDWRRTGLPAIQPGQDNVNGDRIPVRFFYPDDEQTLNATNYQEAVGRMGGNDDINAKMWLIQ